MKRFRFLRRQDPVAGLSWNFDGKSSDRPESSLSWNFEEAPGSGPQSGLSWHFEEAVRISAPTDIAPSVASRHIAAAAHAARLIPVPGPTRVEATGSSRRVTATRRRLVLGGLMSSITAKVLLGTVAALAATGGAAAANVLPDPVQAVVSDAAAAFGINLPSPDDDLVIGEGLDDPNDEQRPNAPVDDRQDDDADDQGGDDTDAGDQGEDADDQGEDADDQGDDDDQGGDDTDDDADDADDDQGDDD